MTDFWKWQEEGAELDAVMAKHSGSSYPPGVLDAYIARQTARHKAMQDEIDRLNSATPMNIPPGGDRPADGHPSRHQARLQGVSAPLLMSWITKSS